ncbi:MAG: DUF309 domain-containing protein [Thaumarchaeota archaeon]|nr:DUF309 domain-containing protein [Nitrososphaerota archaeon]MBT4510175.1 DUF309 domain-containing protein [Nitrososphaerota archaeon]MBT4675891.1 DUF309 domain-containing protein [Nitrososphaerota archaeon]MBT5992903.1 DUF309 domain-containing protein [Nitrososphaerota archaeon]MBT6170996.1 DUF309 domain-containing protein [Nitrososphaerota archaeon]
MARYMLHLKNSSELNRKMAKDILRKSRIIASGMNLTLRDCRVSKKYVEFDTTISESDLDELVEKLSSIGPLDHAKHVIEEIVEKEKAISEGVDYFNNERFWECHEILEGVWKNCDGNEKFLVQGLILVAAGLVHYQKDEDSICISIFNRALGKLENSNGNYHNIDIDKIKEIITEMINSKDVSSFLI